MDAREIAAGGLLLGLGVLAWYHRCMLFDPFDRPAEAYAPSEPVTTCDPFPRTGPRMFRDWILREYGGRSGGIERACDVGGPSPHHEGRAWDWFPPNRETADKVIACLNANGDELARRAGLRNMIYWGRTWNAGRASFSDGWKAYKYADSQNDTQAHRNHVHFAFSWAGAEARTSLYDQISPDSQSAAPHQLGQLDQVTVPAQRTMVSYSELRRGLVAGHREQFGTVPSAARLRLGWSMVGHETDQTRSMWNWNVGNIACTKNWPTCHALKVRDPKREPTRYRSYDDLEHGAADWWRLLGSRYPLALDAMDRGSAGDTAAELKKRGYYGQRAEVYAHGLQRHAEVYDKTFGKPSPILPIALVFLAGGAIYKWG